MSSESLKVKIDKRYAQYIIAGVIFFIAIIKLYFFGSTDLFFDELIIHSKSDTPFIDSLYYSLAASNHPPLHSVLMSYLFEFKIKSIITYRAFFVILNALTCFSILFVGKNNTVLKIFSIVLTLNIFIFSYSLLITSYSLSINLLILFHVFFYKYLKVSGDTKEKTIYFWLTIILSSLSFLTHYFCGMITLLEITILFLLKRKDNFKLWHYSLHIPICWMLMRWVGYLIDKKRYKTVILESVVKYDFYELLPMFLLLVFVVLIFAFSLKNGLFKRMKSFEQKFIKVLLMTNILSLCIFIALVLMGYKVYLRYTVFMSIPSLFIISFYLREIKKISLFIVIGIYGVLNYYRPMDISYLGISNIHQIFDTITEYGRYSNNIYFFSKKPSWYKFYFEDYRIENNFNLKTYREKQFELGLSYVGKNTFLVANRYEYKDFRNTIMSLCNKEKISKCYDLSNKDSFVILKMFEYKSQPKLIDSLEDKLF